MDVIDKDTYIYVFNENGMEFIGFNLNLAEWLVIVDGKHITVNKNFMCPIKAVKLDTLVQTRKDLATDAVLALSRTIVLPASLSHIPSETLQRAIINFLAE